jgi:hypothetical protein
MRKRQSNFTIRHPHTGKIFYWEHFGKMDNESYAKNTIAKLSFYVNHEIISEDIV